MSKKSGGYMNLGYVISIILAIIPITNFIFGLIERISNKSYLLAVLNFFIFPLFWLVDLVSIILNNKLKYLV
jgi:hypothetical protein